MTTKPSFVFFGTPDIAVAALDALLEAGLIPELVVTAPDAPQGRGLTLTPPPVKLWAEAHSIPVIQPLKLSDKTFLAKLRGKPYDAFVLVAYGKIIPESVLAVPRMGTLNMHPSLLPNYRGPSPIESQILGEKDADGVGVSVMLLDAEMDHGPLLAQQTAALPSWPIGARALRETLARLGGTLLAKTLPEYLAGNIKPHEQNHALATYCKKIQKNDAHIDLSGDVEKNYRMILAYEVWPRAYFTKNRNGKEIRVIITKATRTNDALVIERVIPEGKKEMTYEEFLAGLH